MLYQFRGVLHQVMALDGEALRIPKQCECCPCPLRGPGALCGPQPQPAPPADTGSPSAWDALPWGQGQSGAESQRALSLNCSEGGRVGSEPSCSFTFQNLLRPLVCWWLSRVEAPGNSCLCRTESPFSHSAQDRHRRIDCLRKRIKRGCNNFSWERTHLEAGKPRHQKFILYYSSGGGPASIM